MASSSWRPNKNDEDHKEDHEEENWLELGLGVTTRSKTQSRSNSSGSSPFSTRPHSGLGLGFADEGFERRIRRSGSIHLQGLWDHQHYYHQHHHHASPSWACQHRHYSRRPQTGFWFSLRSSYDGEMDALPQVPKAYIRVKDEDVTVFMVKKYLVGKLGLASEAQIDILCMGQSLIQSQTLKDVRDVVWLPRLFQYSLEVIASIENAHASSASLLMPLQYRKHCFQE